MDGFFKNDEPAPEKKTKKRKIEETDTTYKDKARLICKCPEQWKIVSRYSAEKLKAWVQEKEFEETKLLHETIFSFVQKAIAFGLDKLSGGDSYVRDEINADLSLRNAIETEAGNFVDFLSNRVKIIALLATDTCQGKLKQRQNTPVNIIEIQEVKDGHNSQESETEREVPLDSNDALDRDNERQKGLGENMPAAEDATRQTGVEGNV